MINIKIKIQREINKFVKNDVDYMICRVSDSSKEKFNKYVKELLADTISDSDAESIHSNIRGQNKETKEAD